MNQEQRTSVIMIALLMSFVASGCSSTGAKNDADQDEDRTYVTGTRIPYRGPLYVGKMDKNDVRDSIRVQDMSRNPGSGADR
ncbi:hypothetical protein [Roseateles oligotrophus]|uniref:Uncharacterized protein n=1 Tax=Roseateles oligotrophus TaxID=1769250 RepID=A0ABT2YGM6_9BURK|nr:hypothetical protein [Roseateles oligotrophus]MCV2369192.1 hypothetical protein [Roseateles oligotrophus]